VSPAQQGLGEGVQAVVEPVFVGEEARRQGWHLAGVLAAGVHQLADVATRAERLLAAAAQQHAGDVGILRPGLQPLPERLDHRQAQGIEALGRGQGGHADALAVQAAALLETYRRVHALRQRGSRFSRKALTPSRVSAASNRSTKRSRSALSQLFGARSRAPWISGLMVRTATGLCRSTRAASSNARLRASP